MLFEPHSDLCAILMSSSWKSAFILLNIRFSNKDTNGILHFMSPWLYNSPSKYKIWLGSFLLNILTLLLRMTKPKLKWFIWSKHRLLDCNLHRNISIKTSRRSWSFSKGLVKFYLWKVSPATDTGFSLNNNSLYILRQIHIKAGDSLIEWTHIVY